MSRFDRAVGLVRSLAIYHGIPLRQRRLRRLYAQLVGPGDLVFDIGAHAGSRARAFAALGCRVVAVEPQPDFAWLLRRLFTGRPQVEVVESAVSDTVGRASLSISERTPTVTTLAAPWRASRALEPEFARVRWNRRLEIQTTTMDALIERCGLPRFVKIDVEGAEPAVLAGLTRAVPALSFEYLPRALDHVEACLARLAALGSYRYNWSAGETHRFGAPTWLTAKELLGGLPVAGPAPRPGDVYARLAEYNE